ncbi:MAG: phosphoribosylaminoimidazolesuccinocarboxamide synthase [Oscillospiraceae bacterium]
MAQYEKGAQLYEGKAKKVYATSDPNVVLVDYKDDATAFNGLKKGTIVGKGVINNRVSNHMMKLLEAEGIPTHLIEQLSDRETAVKKVRIVPLEVIVRNVAAGSMAKRYGIEEGRKLTRPVLEFSYKNDELGDPLLNDDHAVAMELATPGDIAIIRGYALRINEFMKKYLRELGIELIDFKLEFGKTADGTIILADEISPDTCRFWDSKTGEKLDKDRFRRDLGNVEGAYHEILHRLIGE